MLEGDAIFSFDIPRKVKLHDHHAGQFYRPRFRNAKDLFAELGREPEKMRRCRIAGLLDDEHEYAGMDSLSKEIRDVTFDELVASETKAYSQIYLDPSSSVARSVPLPERAAKSTRETILFVSTDQKTISGTHFDESNSLLYVANGTKIVRFAPRAALEPDEFARSNFDPHDPRNASDGWASMTLLEGEAILIPRGWWHSIVSTAPFTLGISIDLAGCAEPATSICDAQPDPSAHPAPTTDRACRGRKRSKEKEKGVRHCNICEHDGPATEFVTAKCCNVSYCVGCYKKWAGTNTTAAFTCPYCKKPGQRHIEIAKPEAPRRSSRRSARASQEIPFKCTVCGTSGALLSMHKNAEHDDVPELRCLSCYESWAAGDRKHLEDRRNVSDYDWYNRVCNCDTMISMTYNNEISTANVTPFSRGVARGYGARASAVGHLKKQSQRAAKKARTTAPTHDEPPASDGGDKK